ncbi:BrnA antitoxin family protein [Rhodopseudomonas parapalustris]
MVHAGGFAKKQSRSPKCFPISPGPNKALTKRLVSLRLAPEVIDTYKAGGPGWQSRIDADLRRINKIKRPRRFVSGRSSRRLQFVPVVALSTDLTVPET